MSNRPLRVGLFGGAFDPPHNAHLALARCAVAQLQLDVLHILPTGQAWHRAQAPSAAADRLAMAQLAFGGVERVQVDARETLRSGPTYTADTLIELQRQYPRAALFLVIGADQAGALTRWNRWEQIVADATICIAARAQPAGVAGTFPAWPGARTETIRMPLMQVSATDIRERVATGQGVSHLVPEPVARYIEHHHLYQTT